MEDLVLSCLESRVEANRNLYARFLVGPFLKGDALTVATALRRVLLSSVESIGITALYIQGITHEFSTIAGVRESVLDLSLNFQAIVLCYDNDLFQNKDFFDDIQIGYLQVQGPKIVYANDLKLPLGVKLVDPTQYIATVAKEGSIVLKFVIGKRNNLLRASSCPAHVVSANGFSYKKIESSASCYASSRKYIGCMSKNMSKKFGQPSPLRCRANRRFAIGATSHLYTPCLTNRRFVRASNTCTPSPSPSTKVLGVGCKGESKQIGTGCKCAARANLRFAKEHVHVSYLRQLGNKKGVVIGARTSPQYKSRHLLSGGAHPICTNLRLLFQKGLVKSHKEEARHKNSAFYTREPGLGFSTKKLEATLLRRPSIYFPILGELIRRDITRAKKGFVYFTRNRSRTKTWFANLVSSKSYTGRRINLFSMAYKSCAVRAPSCRACVQSALAARVRRGTSQQTPSLFCFSKINERRFLQGNANRKFVRHASKVKKEHDASTGTERRAKPGLCAYAHLSPFSLLYAPSSKSEALKLGNFKYNNESGSFVLPFFRGRKTMTTETVKRGTKQSCFASALKIGDLDASASANLLAFTFTLQKGASVRSAYKSSICKAKRLAKGLSLQGYAQDLQCKRRQGQVEGTLLRKEWMDTKTKFCIPTALTPVEQPELNFFRSSKKSRFLSKNKVFKSDICLRNIIPLDPTLTPILKVNFVIEIDDEVLYLRQKIRERIILEVWTNGSIHPRQAVHNAALSLTDMFAGFRSVYQVKSYFLPLFKIKTFNKTSLTPCFAKKGHAKKGTARPRLVKRVTIKAERGTKKEGLKRSKASARKSLVLPRTYVRCKDSLWKKEIRNRISMVHKVPSSNCILSPSFFGKGRRRANLIKQASLNLFESGFEKKVIFLNSLSKKKINDNFIYKTKLERDSLFFSDLGELPLPLNIYCFLKKKGIEKLSTLKSFSSFDLLLFLEGDIEMFYNLKRFLLKNNFPLSERHSF